MFFENTFELSNINLERIRKFLGSQERSRDTHNINKYWLYRRMKMEFDLFHKGIKIKNDTNLSNFGQIELNQNPEQRFPAVNALIERNLKRIVYYGRFFFR